MATYIDPPEGWRYGFPKVLPKPMSGKELDEWLVSQGYPESMLALARVATRMWEKPDIIEGKWVFCPQDL